jgi:putative tryptophan/tyrosine transport system substrate-binding protein
MMPPREGPPMERRGKRLSRRGFVLGAGGLGLLAGCGRLPGKAEAPARVPQIGFLASSFGTSFPLFQDGLREYGYVEGQNIAVEYRHGEGRVDRLPDLAAELVGLPVDLIVTLAGPAAQAAKNTTSTIPIVFINIADPVAEGLVDSLAQPGANATGTSILSGPLSTKRLELLRVAVPEAARIGLLSSPVSRGEAVNQQETQGAAQVLGVPVQSFELRGPEELDAVFDAVAREGVDALLVTQRALYTGRIPDIVARAATGRLPVMYTVREAVDVGGLMSFGPDNRAQYRRAAYYVDRILKGAKPADLPVEQPMTFEFVVNMNTAQALGITFPNEIMLQVTEVIQ